MKCSHCHGTGEEPAMNGALPKSILAALSQCPTLGHAPRLWKSEYWKAEYHACPDVTHDQELYKAEAWLVANPGRAPKKDLGRFVHNWLARAQQREAEGA